MTTISDERLAELRDTARYKLGVASLSGDHSRVKRWQDFQAALDELQHRRAAERAPRTPLREAAEAVVARWDGEGGGPLGDYVEALRAAVARARGEQP